MKTFPMIDMLPGRPVAAVLAGAAILAGCASYIGVYQQAAAGNGNATLVIQRADNALMHGGSQQFIGYDNPACKSSPGSGIMATKTMFTTADAPIQVVADKRLFLRVETDGIASFDFQNAPPIVTTDRKGRPVQVDSFIASQKACVSVASFVPEAGHRYETLHRMSPDGCVVQLVDKATGEAPASFESLPIPQTCLVPNWPG